VVIVTDPYDCILGFLDRSRYFFFQVAPYLYSMYIIVIMVRLDYCYIHKGCLTVIGSPLCNPCLHLSDAISAIFIQEF
jgi:hypothetical protein